MKLRVLASLLLGCLFVMTAQGDSSSAGVIPAGQEEDKNNLEVTGITAMFSEKESFRRTGVAHRRKLKKLMTRGESSMDSRSKKGADGIGTSKISGNDEGILKMSFRSLREPKNDEKKHMTITGPNASKFANFVIPRSGLSYTNSKFSQDFVAFKTSLKSSSRTEQQISEESQGTTQKDETESLVEVEKEIVNLIHKDYVPRRKPPINNHEPRN